METIKFMREILKGRLESQKCIELIQYHSRSRLLLITLERIRCSSVEIDHKQNE